MRVVGTLFVLAACAAIQLPWFSCLSDCQQAFLPMWDLGVHHCHDEAAHRAGRSSCGCCAAEDAAGDHAAGDHAAPVRQAEDGLRAAEPDHDHGPGDHELQLRSSRRPASVDTPTPDPGACAFGPLPPMESEAPLPTGCAVPGPGALETGPPHRLASVRLLL